MGKRQASPPVLPGAGLFFGKLWQPRRSHHHRIPDHSAGNPVIRLKPLSQKVSVDLGEDGIHEFDPEEVERIHR